MICMIGFLMSSCFENDYLEDIPVSEIEAPFTIKQIEKTDITYYTYLNDSIDTSSKETFLLGNYQDEYRGHVIAEPYFQFELNSVSTSFDEEYEFDSMVLYLKIDATHYDTAFQFPLSVYQVMETIEYRLEDDMIYNFETFGKGKSPIVTQDVKIFPADDSLGITLPYEFGYQLFEKSRGSTSILNTTDDFRDAIKGISLAAENTSPIISLTKETHLSFFYHNSEEMEPTSLEYQIPIGDFSLGFTHLETDFTNTPFKDIVAEEFLAASESNDLAIADELSGARIRVEIENLDDIPDVPYDYYISEANLFVPIKKGTYDTKFNPLADHLDVYIQSKNKQVKSYLTTTTINSFDEIFQEATYFKIPITSFVDDIIAGTQTGNGLLLEIYPEQYLTTGYMVVGENLERYKTRLEITIIPLN